MSDREHHPSADPHRAPQLAPRLTQDELGVIRRATEQYRDGVQQRDVQPEHSAWRRAVDLFFPGLK